MADLGQPIAVARPGSGGGGPGGPYPAAAEGTASRFAAAETKPLMGGKRISFDKLEDLEAAAEQSLDQGHPDSLAVPKEITGLGPLPDWGGRHETKTDSLPDWGAAPKELPGRLPTTGEVFTHRQQRLGRGHLDPQAAVSRLASLLEAPAPAPGDVDLLDVDVGEGDKDPVPSASYSSDPCSATTRGDDEQPAGEVGDVKSDEQSDEAKTNRADHEVDEKMRKWQERRKERRERLRGARGWNYGRAARAMYKKHFASEDLMAALCARGVEMTKVSKIGEGSFSRVYKGFWVERQEVVVVKLIRKAVFHTEIDIPPEKAEVDTPAPAADGGEQDAAFCPMRHPTWLLREIEVNQSNCHQNLVRILRAFLHDLPYIMVFEHCAGGSLHSLLHRPLFESWAGSGDAGFESPTHQRLGGMQADDTSSPTDSHSAARFDSVSSSHSVQGTRSVTSSFSQMFGGTQSRNITMDDLGDLMNNLFLASEVDLKRLGWRQRVIIALDVARGMAHLHEREIIHRDLRPDNVLLMEPIVSLQQVPHAKVGDFGLSRRMPTLKGSDLMTCEVGTVPYMAPELFSRNQGEDARPYDELADIYSYSVLVSELLSDQLPFTGTPVENAARHKIIAFVQEGGRPQVTPLPEMPQVLHDLMVGCWADDPRDRPGFSSISSQLEQLLGAMPVIRAPVSAPTSRGSRS